MSNDIDEVIVTESEACLRRQVDQWFFIHAEGFVYDVAWFDSAADVRRFLTAALAALDEWEAHRG